MPFHEITVTKCKRVNTIKQIRFNFYIIFFFSYVQDLIGKEKAMLKDLIINRGGYFYVSGSSKNMPNAVKKALKVALEDESYVDNMVATGRYQEETWS